MTDILFPKNINCIFCNIPISRTNRYSLCKNCFEKIEFVKEICTNCGRTGEHSSLCTYCYGEHYYYDKVYSVIKYNDFIHGKIYGYKYGHKNYLADYFAEIVNNFVISNEIEFDYLTGVPISDKRMRVRGFNQTYLIAKKITHEERYLELFYRKRHTKFLSKLSNSERKRELEGAFGINQGALDYIVENSYSNYNNIDQLEKTKKLKILIFDDIFTTGSTINELSKLLKKTIMNVEVTALTLCNAKNFNLTLKEAVPKL